ncbi:hypothetical protein HQ550_01730 [bacterium]|nr:hypothetical protein [bacterium]
MENNPLFFSEPDIDSLAENIKIALISPQRRNIEILKEYCWDRYFLKVSNEIKKSLK